MLSVHHKRLPENPNIKLHWGPDYSGYELIQGVGPFVEPHLAKIEEVVTWARQQSSKLYALRLDLRFPQHYELSNLGDLSNKPVQSFIKLFRARLDRYCAEGEAIGVRRHSHNLAVLWAREYDLGHTRPHFHVLLLLNGQAFRRLGGLNYGGRSLYRMIEDSWLSALRCQGLGTDKLIHICDRGQYWINTADQAAVEGLFQRASYMAKVGTKEFNDGCHRFGGSRV